MTWLDAELTPNGVAQVTAANLFWKNALSSTKPPMPQSFYVSPMARCLNTANTTWADIPWEKGHTFSPTVKEVRVLRMRSRCSRAKSAPDNLDPVV